MGQRLALNVKRNGEVLFVIYQHWGGYTDNEVEVICRLKAVYDKDDDFVTLLRKTTEVLPGSGLILPQDPLELESIKPYLNEGIRISQNRSAGFIALTTKEMKNIWDWDDDEQDLDLDGEICISDIYYVTNTPDEGAEPEPAQNFLFEPITKENAMDLLNLFHANYSDWYQSKDIYYFAITG